MDFVNIDADSHALDASRYFARRGATTSAPASNALPRAVLTFPSRPRAVALSGKPVQPSAAPPATLLRILRTTADSLAISTTRAAAAQVLREIADDLDPSADDIAATLAAARPGDVA